AHNAVRPEVSAFFAGLPLRPRLWEALRDLAASDEGRALEGPRRRLLDKTVADFRRHGAELDAAGKERLEAIVRELAELTSRFGQNVLDATAAWEKVVASAAELEGLPPSALEAARESAERRGVEGYRFTLQAPSYVPVLTYAKNRALREEVYRAVNTRASSGEHDNAPLIERILALRAEQAALLGYRTFPDLVLEDRMAGSADRARAFVTDLTERSRRAFARETAELAAYAAAQVGLTGPLAPWDVPYVAELERRARYDFDEEELRPYFPLDRSVQGLFETAQRLYGIDIRESRSLPTWHPDVRTYEIRDEDGTHLGSFYADFHPRDEKRGGAWMNSLVTGVDAGGALGPHLGLICTNVSPPVGRKPALLTHQELLTLFHEFGHLLHHCLTRVPVRSLAGTNVAWDFVELPSQILENWGWERAALDTFAAHHETGEKIPDALFGRMLAARRYREASAMMRQLGFAAVDLLLHTERDASRDGPVLAAARRLMASYAPAELPENYAMIASFSHLFSSPVGYAGGYYSYKWAEVLDADAFTRFRAEGIHSRTVGMAFRRAILERGDGADPMQLYREFMGREPRLDALLERSGLLEPAGVSPAAT
ncbi:MAG: M3 family metallopeptidase, partial [Deltaproteobacteria bacterium]|nr:M3 family metallopeptidase [Deltaproteobacteria bacterium]